MHKLAKDHVKIELKCIKNKSNVLKSTDRGMAHRESQDFHLRNAEMILRSSRILRILVWVSNSKCKRESLEREIEIVRYWERIGEQDRGVKN